MWFENRPAREVQDVVKMIDFTFRSANPVTEFCEPCGM
jgi:hypothetical protein